jgi:F-type H+-transporting ATPase subunit b
MPVVVLACAAGLALAAGNAGAQSEHAAHGVSAHAAPNAAPAAPGGAHAAPGAPYGGEAHAEGAHAEHDPNAPPAEINWWHGIAGEKKGVAPSLLWRAPGEPAPFIAAILNFAVLVFLFVYFGKKPLANALAKRKTNIMREMDEAGRMRADAEKRLAEYEAKLARLAGDVQAIRAEYREHGERDKERIVREAKERAVAMHADAEQVLEQEQKQMRRDVLAEAVESATKLATRLISEKGNASDQDRFAEAFLTQLRTRSAPGGRGGAL